MLTHYGGTEAVRRSSAEPILFLQQFGEHAPEPRHDPEWLSFPWRSGEGRFRWDADPKVGVGKFSSLESMGDFPHNRAMIRTFQGITPTIPKSTFVEQTALVIGDVVIGEESSVWFNAVVRGDVHYIRIGNRTNIQDLSILHVTHDTYPLVLGDEVTIGHHVVLHGCTIKDRVLVGMGAIIMDGAVIGEDSLVGAGALVTERTIVPANSLVLGSPAKVKRPVTQKELAWISESAQHYVLYSRQYLSDPAGPPTGFKV